MSKLGKIFFLLAGVSIVVFVVARFILGGFIPFFWFLIGFAILFFVLGLYFERSFLKEFFTMRTTKHGMNMGAMILLVLLLLIVINFLAVRNYKTFDFSSSKANTLSDQSIKVVQSLDSDLNIRFFYKKGTEGNEQNRSAFSQLVKRYQDVSAKVRLDYVELNERPDLATEYGVDKGSGVVFVDYKGKKNRIDKIEESEITNAIIKVTKEKDKIIYVVEGHGEASLEESQEATGLNSLKLMLENNRYQIKSHAFSQNPKLPADADVVLIAGPKQQFLDFEITAVEDYLKAGGSLFVALDPKNNSGLDKLFSKLGIEFSNNYIANVIQAMGGVGVLPGPTFANEFSSSDPVTKVFGRKEVVIFRQPMAIKKMATVPSGITIDEIVKTGSNSMSFEDMQFSKTGSQGPFTVVVRIKGKMPNSDAAKEFNIILAADSDFMTNQMLYQNLNRDLVLNSVASLAKEENLISITPKETEKTQMTLTQTKFYTFFFGFILPVPILLLATSVTLWTRRRNA